MTPRQMELTRKAFTEFKTFPMPDKRPFDDQDLRSLLDEHGLVTCNLNLPCEKISGFTRIGRMQLRALAKDLLGERAERVRRISEQKLTEVIVNVAASQWRSLCPTVELTLDEMEDLKLEITTWIDKFDRVRTHYIPCTMYAWNISRFSIGPVHFYPLSDFPLDAIGLKTEDVWPPDNGPISPLATINFSGGILKLAEMRHAATIAEIDVPGREPQQSALTANITVDIAIGIFQLLMPQGYFSRASRATARGAPVWWATLSCEDGRVMPSTHNDEPGRTLSPDYIKAILTGNSAVISSTGRRLKSYLAGSGSLPTLDEAWCSAVYWYHEAIAETLETVAIAKLETAIEVLFRSESSKGSKQRLLLGLEAFLGVDKKTQLDGGITLDKFAASIVTARSRVLHGTWPTFHTELPDGKENIPVSLVDVEKITRLLLLSFSLALDDYATLDNAENSVELFLNWQKNKHPLIS